MHDDHTLKRTHVIRGEEIGRTKDLNNREPNNLCSYEIILILRRES